MINQMNYQSHINYQNQSQANSKGYLNQVTLIESECEPRKKPANIPATVFNRSPLRDRENKINLSNMGGTPTRVGNKTSLSPLRARKTDASINMNSKSITNRKKMQMECTNHPSKVAKYVVESDEETMFYCEKCAILLASQGFKVSKMGQPVQDHQRKREVDEFLNELEVLMNNLLIKQNRTDNILKKGVIQYQSQVQKIQAYYAQLYETIDQHKNQVLQQMKIEFDNSSHSVNQLSQGFSQAIAQSNSMKQDIHSSMNSIIMDAAQEEYRPVMDLYKQKVRKYKQVLNRNIPQQEVIVRKVCLNNGQQVCRAIEQGIRVEWDDQKQEQSKIEESVTEGRPINPVQCLQSEEKFAKSSLKEIGNLFCSFDQ